MTNSDPAVSADTRQGDQLRRAIEAGEIVPWYQPIIDLPSGAVTGVEALARWIRDGRTIPPAEFIPFAESSELVIALDLAVIRGGLDDLRRWQQLHPRFELNVNLSGRHLDSATGIADLIEAVDSAGVAAQSIAVELTETSRPSAVDHGTAGLEAMRERGLSVWLDDFGCGYYNLQDLIRLPVDGIKFDRSFTAQLDGPRAAPLIGGLTTAAHQMGMRVTLEGIETPAQATAGRQLGCDLGQGYLWSRPLPAAEVFVWLSEGSG